MKNISYMAFAEGQKSEESAVNFSRYIGVSPVRVLAVNPDKKTLEKIYDRNLEKEPNYKLEDGTQIIEFIVATDPEWGNKIEHVGGIRFFLKKESQTNKEKTKVKVIDTFGQTAWVTKEQYEKQEVPETAKRVIPPYRQCMTGEEELVMFIKTLLSISDSTSYKNGVWTPATDLTKCKAGFSKDEISNICAGRVDLLKNIIKEAAEYKIKVMFGVKTGDDNKIYQTINNQVFLKNGSTYYERFKKEIQRYKDSGIYQNIEYSHTFLTEYIPVGTELNTVYNQERAPVAEIPDLNSPEPQQANSEEKSNFDDLPF